jgi:hypothetical protein
MKKIIAMFSSLLIFSGVKAQTTALKKETVKPSAQMPLQTNTSTTIIKVSGKEAPMQKVSKFGKLAPEFGKLAPAGKEATTVKPVKR